MNVVKYFTNCIAVFQGGGCKAIAYIGAYEKAYQEGVFFSELAGTSAGAVIAALIAAGASPEYMKKIVKELNFNVFKYPCGKSSWPVRMAEVLFVLKQKNVSSKEWLRLFPQTWKNCKPYSWKALDKKLGLFNSVIIEKKMEKWLRELTGKEKVTFKDLAPNLHIVSTDIIDRTVIEWNKEKSPDMSVARAVRASCSIPVYFTPTMKRWVDGGLVSNCPDFIFSEDPNYYQMLTFRLRSENPNKTEFDGFLDYGKQLVNTIVEGADNLQHTFISSPNEIEIKTSVVSATDFDKITPQIVDELIEVGSETMREFLDQKEAEFAEKQEKGTDDFWPRVILKHQEQMHSMLAYWGYVKYDEVFVCCDDTAWSWSIFPTLLNWVNNGSKIVVYIQADANIDNKEMSRRRMLEAMGCLLKIEENMPFKGFFFVNQNGGRGVVFKGKNKDFKAKVYSDELDGQAIHGWINQLKSKVQLSRLEPYNIEIIPVEPADIIDRLKTDRIYRNARMYFDNIQLKDLLFLNSTIRSLKYKHISHMFEMYQKRNLEPFSPAALVFKNDKRSYIGPPVVEIHNGKYYVIEGNTRCLYAYKHGMTSLKMLVVENVKKKLPVEDINNCYPIEKVIITERKIEAKERYKGFDYSHFRHIEECLRPYDTYLK